MFKGNERAGAGLSIFHQWLVRGNAGQTNYAASKAGIEGYSPLAKKLTQRS